MSNSDIFESSKRVVVGELETKIGQMVRDEVEVEVDESLGVIIAGGVAAWGWTWLRNTQKAINDDKMMREFFKFADPRGETLKLIDEVKRKFKLVKSLTDLATIEKDVEKTEKRLEQLKRSAGRFDVKSVLQSEDTFVDKALMTTVKREEKRLKNNLDNYIQGITKTFNEEIQQKRDELF